MVEDGQFVQSLQCIQGLYMRNWGCVRELIEACYTISQSSNVYCKSG